METYRYLHFTQTVQPTDRSNILHISRPLCRCDIVNIIVLFAANNEQYINNNNTIKWPISQIP